MAEADIGLIGLAAMGRNLALNLVDHGASVAVYNRTTARMREFLADVPDDAALSGHATLEELVAVLARPRRIILMVSAGPAVDAVLDELVALLDAGDVVVDGGNSHWTDTERRADALAEPGVHFVGAGISGGEDGARHGPSIMPGGDAAAWPLVGGVLQRIAAEAPDGTPCCDWIGPGGAGHFVKMVHNGIEYADMQVIAEAYHLMSVTGMSNTEMSQVFAEWNEGALRSFLVEITAEILGAVDDDGVSVVDLVLDAGAQKGTGRWTAVAALELGEPLTLVAEAVDARILSSFHERRQVAAARLAGPDRRLAPHELSLDDVRDAMHASRVVAYAQGFGLMRRAGAEHGWELDLARIASLWRAGCIIRATVLDDVAAAYSERPDLDDLLIDDRIAPAVGRAQPGWRRAVSLAVRTGVPVPAWSSALAHHDGIRSARLPANLIQAQRDRFGAHTYERVDRPRGEHFHTDWAALAAERRSS